MHESLTPFYICLLQSIAFGKVRHVTDDTERLIRIGQSQNCCIKKTLLDSMKPVGVAKWSQVIFG